jgi:acetyl-CoA C-acetyltransferase
MESMSQAPHLLNNGRTGWKYGDQLLVDAVDLDGLRCAQLGLVMGCLAEWTSADSQVSRADQDRWALQSHMRASAAQKSGDFDREIVPLFVQEAKKTVERKLDECPRPDTNLEGLAKLRPVFVSDLVTTIHSDYQATVTAGNASSLSDGAAAVVVVDQIALGSMKTDWAFRVVAHTNHAADHKMIFTAPVGAIEKLLHSTGLSAGEIDLFEINEAFASQTLACIRKLKLREDRVNLRGGAIALGHPLGCSGTRVLVTLIHTLLAKKLTRGIASLCLGGGEAVALLIERVQ